MLTLIRNDFLDEGIFGRLLRKDGEVIAVTLEYSYLDEQDQQYKAKIPPGRYACQRTKWYRKPGDADDIDTYEVKNVPNATRILFHPGNYEKDTQGCILLGTSRTGSMVALSRVAFQNFMKLIGHKSSFFLTIEESR